MGLKPLIEIVNGKLVAGKKYRGTMKNVSKKLVSDFIKQYHLEAEMLYFMFNDGLQQEIKHEVEDVAKELGYLNVLWIRAGGVISTHSGPGGFGICGFSTP